MAASWGKPGVEAGRGRRCSRRRSKVTTFVRPLDEGLGRAAGSLLARDGSADVIGAALVLLAHDGDDIVTSDPDDIEALATRLGRHMEVLRF